jgi:hypothetical protein
MRMVLPLWIASASELGVRHAQIGLGNVTNPAELAGLSVLASSSRPTGRRLWSGGTAQLRVAQPDAARADEDDFESQPPSRFEYQGHPAARQ